MTSDLRPPINLADEIGGSWQHVVIATFGVDLGFFEQAVLPLLPRARARLVLADHSNLLAHQASAVRDGIVRHWNHSYLVAGVRHAHAAHAKLILLTTSDRGRLLVGSGNLGVTGWTSVGELFTRYDYTAEGPEQISAFQAAREFLDTLAKRNSIDPFAAAYLNEIWQGSPWLGEGSSSDASVRHNFYDSFVDQLAALSKRSIGKVERLVAMAPFHDPGANTLSMLIERFRPGKATIVLQDGHTSADSNSLSRLRDKHQETEIEFLVASARDHPDTHLHAKMILVEGGGQAFCLQGSSNLSGVAMLKSGHNANIELANLLSGSEGAFDHVLAALELTVIDDPRDLQLGIREFTSLELGGSDQLLLLSVGWDGEHLHLEVLTDLDWSHDEPLFIRINNDLIPTQVVVAESNADGVTLITVLPQAEVEQILSKAAAVALLPPGVEPGSVLRDESLLSNPVFCVHRPALRHLLEARSSYTRLRDLGPLDSAGDDELNALVEALQSAIVLDTQTLVAAAPPRPSIADLSDEDAIYLAYAEIDYERLREDPALRQYLHAGPSEYTASLQLGLEPLGIQMALRSITDAFRSIVDLSDSVGIAGHFDSDWTVIDQDVPDDKAFIPAPSPSRHPCLCLGPASRRRNCRREPMALPLSARFCTPLLGGTTREITRDAQPRSAPVTVNSTDRPGTRHSRARKPHCRYRR